MVLNAIANTGLSSSFVLQENAESFIESGSGAAKQGTIDRRAVWGVFCVYLAIGTVGDFFVTFLSQPTLCQYVFGPMGSAPGDHTTLAQCNVATSVFQISWNFKLFFGFFLDLVPFFGSRRKGWIMFGWTGGLAMLAITALFVDDFVLNHQFESYVGCLTIMCFCYCFSDVAADGMVVEMSKFEPDDRKGYILTTCQMLRFTMMMISTVFGTLAMSGDDYQPPPPLAPGSLVLPFELKLSQVHWMLFAIATPFYIGMWVWIRDPPAAEEGHESICEGARVNVGKVWTAMKSTDTNIFSPLADSHSKILKEVHKIPSQPAHYAIIIGILTCIAAVIIPVFGAMLLIGDENYTFWIGYTFPVRVIAASLGITLLLMLVCGLLYAFASPQRQNESTMALVASLFAALLGVSYVLAVLPAAHEIQVFAGKLSHGCSSSLSNVVALSDYGQVLANLRSNSTCAESISVEACDGWASNKYTRYIRYLESEFECQVCPGVSTPYSLVQGGRPDNGASRSNAKYQRQRRLQTAGHQRTLEAIGRSSLLDASGHGPEDHYGSKIGEAPKLFAHGSTMAPCLPLVAARMNVLAWTSYDLIFCEGVALIFVSLIVSCSSCLGVYCIKSAPSAAARRGAK